ncbi:unnamed protein product [Leuciscus chuanchicus]
MSFLAHAKPRLHPTPLISTFTACLLRNVLVQVALHYGISCANTDVTNTKTSSHEKFTPRNKFMQQSIASMATLASSQSRKDGSGIHSLSGVSITNIGKCRFHRCAWLERMFIALKRFVMKKKCSLQANVAFRIQIQPLQPAKASSKKEERERVHPSVSSVIPEAKKQLNKSGCFPEFVPSVKLSSAERRILPVSTDRRIHRLGRNAPRAPVNAEQLA